MPSVFAPFPAFLFFGRFVSSLRVSCLSLYLFPIVILLESDLLCYLSFPRDLSSDCCVILTGFISCLFSWLHMLTLGLSSAKSHLHVQRIRAELSSNGSSEPLSESLSKLSSHQIPHCLRVPLQLKGCTRTSSLFSPTTPFGGVSALCLLLALHFDRGVESACSAAARVLLASPSRTSPSSCSSCLGLSCTRRLLTPRCAACGSTFPVVRSPFFGLYVILLVVAYLPEVRVRGRTDVFSRSRLLVSSRIALRMSSLLLACSAKPFSTGAARRVFLAATAYNFKSTAA